MRISVMKHHHWAHDWPHDYLQSWERRDQHHRCHKGHSVCAMIEEGPCIFDVLDEVKRGVEDREGNDV